MVQPYSQAEKVANVAEERRQRAAKLPPGRRFTREEVGKMVVGGKTLLGDGTFNSQLVGG